MEVPHFEINNQVEDELQFVDGVPQLVQRGPTIGGVDSHFRPIITPNSSAMVTPLGRNGRAFCHTLKFPLAGLYREACDETRILVNDNKKQPLYALEKYLFQ